VGFGKCIIMQKISKKGIVKLATLITLVIIVASTMGVLFPGHPAEMKTIATPATFLSTAPLTTNLNVTVGRVAYITQPTEWLYNAQSSVPVSFVSPTSSWTLNNSGYLFMANNTTGTTAPTPEVANFPVSNDLGSTVSYIFTDSRLAVNGTGETAYAVVSESAQTGVPSTSANTLSTSAGAAQNMIFIEISNYAVTVGYYSSVLGGNAKYYQNYTSYTFSGITLMPLWFYDFYVNIQSTGTSVEIANATGAPIATYQLSPSPVLDGNLSKVAYVSYVHAPAASTSGDMLILDYAYLVDHNVQPASTVLSGAMVNMPSIVAPFDPNATAANYTTNPNATNSYTSVNMSTDDFTSVTPSSSNATQTSSLINPAYLPQANATTIYAQNQTTSLRTTAENATTVTASLYVTTWTPQGINNAIVSYLQNYIGGKIGVMPSQISIISYLVTDIGFDMNFSSSTATMIQNYIYNSAPGIMQSDGISLVNTTTGAVAAGADIGMFMNPATGVIAYPEIQGNEIINPLTGAIYYSPELAGFPAGSTVMEGTIYVPGQYQFYGFAADGAPIFAAGWNPFASLSGAAAAVSNFFHGAASTVSNAIGKVTKPVTQYVEHAPQLIGGMVYRPITKFTNDLSKAVGGVMPFLGGAATDISRSIGGTLSHVLGGVGSGLASIRNSVTGALATGVTDVKNTLYHIGSTIRNGLVSIPDGVWNTLGKIRSDVGAVISPITTALRNLPGKLGGALTSIGNGIKNGLVGVGTTIANAGKNVLNTVGNSITTAATGAANWLGNAFGQLTGSFVNGASGKFAAAIKGTAVSFFAGISSTLGHYILPIVIGGAIIVLLIAFLVIHERGKKHHRHHGRGR